MLLDDYARRRARTKRRDVSTESDAQAIFDDLPAGASASPFRTSPPRRPLADLGPSPYATPAKRLSRRQGIVLFLALQVALHTVLYLLLEGDHPSFRHWALYMGAVLAFLALIFAIAKIVENRKRTPQ